MVQRQFIGMVQLQYHFFSLVEITIKESYHAILHALVGGLGLQGLKECYSCPPR